MLYSGHNFLAPSCRSHGELKNREYLLKTSCGTNHLHLSSPSLQEIAITGKSDLWWFPLLVVLGGVKSLLRCSVALGEVPLSPVLFKGQV